MSNQIICTEEQSMLLDTALDFCEKHSSIHVVRSRIGEEESLSRDLWSSMVELGWAGINIPETYGGLGLGVGDLVPVVEAMGRNLMVSPLVWSAISADTLLLAGSDEQRANWLPKIAGGAIATMALTEPGGSWSLTDVDCRGSIEGDGIVLSGTKCLVQDAKIADIVLVSLQFEGKPRLALIPQAAIPSQALKREEIIDETRRCYQLTLDGIVLPKEQLLPETCFEAIEQAAMLLISAEMAGGHASTLNLIVEYLKTRKQFDHYIGSYQALKHPTVDILIGLEATRSHLYHAVTIYESAQSHEREIALRMLKATASEGFSFAGDRAIQFHGGFGFTYECDAQLYLRRALWCQYQFGDEDYHRLLLQSLLLDQAG